MASAHLLLPDPVPESASEPGAAGHERRRDGLWQHTCFEFFVAMTPVLVPSRAPFPYREFNFSSNGAWAAYDFCDYRKLAACPHPDLPPPASRIEQDSGHFGLIVLLSRAALPPLPWHGQLSAVTLERDAAIASPSAPLLRYHALAHAAIQPDFHDQRSWQAVIP